MASFLLEIFSEEIPARMQAASAEHLARAFSESLKEAGLAFSAPQTFVTPRRLALIAKDIPAAQPDATTEKKGPRVGAPQAAIDGFLKSTGLPIEKLEKRLVGKDETYFAVLHRKGQPTAAVLKEIAENILNNFPWPKSMRWGSRDTRWVRPLHSILCLFDGKVVPAEFGGITAGSVTYGHRFLAPGAIAIASPEEYAPKLKAAFVLADAQERKAEIAKQAEAVAAKQGLAVKRDDGLLAEVTGLVEWPTVLMGSIDAQYMDLPPEVLVSEMRAHQKYFALLAPTQPSPASGGGQGRGGMSDKFLITSNMVTTDGGKSVIAGNERVLRARLADGRFFWDQDRKKPLSEWAKGLEGVTFHAKIGTMAQKVERIKALAVKLCNSGIAQDPLDSGWTEWAASLCKADLTTGMVGEFPELQGVMGRYYALHENPTTEVADAIRDHYLPLGPDSPVPTAPVSVCVALADKLDTLVSMFAAGEKPTGSKDPFALRRSALGVIRIILENNIRLKLGTVLSQSRVSLSLRERSGEGPVAPAARVAPHPGPLPEGEGMLSAGLVNELLAFFSDRLKVQLKEQGVRHDLISAVMANGDDDLWRVVARAKALQEFLTTEDGANLFAAYRRAANILTIEEKKDKQTYKAEAAESLLQQAEEKELFAALGKTGPQAASALKEEAYGKAMAALAALRKPVDAFFDKVLVNAEDKALRANRLNLLARIRVTLDGIANFSLIEG